MIVRQGVAALRRSDGPLFVVVGVFDGLHRGHRYLLRHLVRAAAVHAARPAVVTFDHHPDEILVGAAPPLLCDPDERLERLARAGVKVTVVQHFDEALRMTSFDAFIASIQARTPVAGFLMTPDAAFGHERRGTPEALEALGRKLGFRLMVVPPFELDGRPVRSTDIRAAIATGDLVGARKRLGRQVAVVGTAIALGEESPVRFALPVTLPPDGRYPVRVVAEGGRPRATKATIAAGELILARPFAGRVRIAFTA